MVKNKVMWYLGKWYGVCTLIICTLLLLCLINYFIVTAEVDTANVVLFVTFLLIDASAAHATIRESGNARHIDESKYAAQINAYERDMANFDTKLQEKQDMKLYLEALLEEENDLIAELEGGKDDEC